ncbi:MAG: protein-disulfide reductase DsbD [Hahellaceae bacterium]|nr:protein-disulfide reductase DsbD [Hahellaceae bacterium]
MRTLNMHRHKRTLTHAASLLMTLCLWMVANMVMATEGEFLPVDEAFQFDYVTQNGQIALNWKIADGYYLYQSRVKAKAAPSVTLTPVQFLTPSEEKNDPYFGLQRIFHHALSAKLEYQSAEETTLTLTYQGCASAGLCYPPQKRQLKVPASLALQPQDSAVAASQTTSTSVSDLEVATEDLSEDAGLLANYLAHASILVVAGLFFVLGLGLTFTPCVLPMVPILSSIIMGQKKTLTTAQSVSLSSAYVLGMATTYASLGATVGLLGAKANLQAMMQQPFILIGFSVLFVVLSLSMFGLFELQLPSFLRDRLQAASDKSEGGKFIGVAIMGAVSALVVSPCVSAPLAGAMIYISTTGDAALGGLALFMMALGMGVPLILIGVSGHRFLPKAGAWMIRVKEVFGFLLLAVAVSLMQRVVEEQIALIFWAVWLIAAGMRLGALHPSEKGWQFGTRTVGILGFIWGILLVIGVATGKGSLTQPLQGLALAQPANAATQTRVHFDKIQSLGELQTRYQENSNVPVLLDVYADWCVSCKVLDKEVFSDPTLAGYSKVVQFVKLDISDFSEEHQQFLSQHGISGPPAVILLPAGQSGKEVKKLLGEFKLKQLVRLLDSQKAAI